MGAILEARRATETRGDAHYSVDAREPQAVALLRCSRQRHALPADCRDARLPGCNP